MHTHAHAHAHNVQKDTQAKAVADVRTEADRERAALQKEMQGLKSQLEK